MQFSCTSNPFSDEKKIANNTRIVSGNIILSDGTTPDSVYVWLEEFDIGTFTDLSGEFRLSLPAAQEQPGGGVTGIFNLYFYVVNYEYKSIEVTINDGIFVYNQGQLDNRGKIIDPVILHKLVDVKTEVFPQNIPADFRGHINVSLILQSIDNPTSIKVIVNENDIINGVFIRNVNKKSEFITQYFMSSSRIQTKTVPTFKTSSTSYYQYNTCEFPKGEYEIIPFLWVEQPNLPPDMIDDFTEYPVRMSLDFLKLPFKRENAFMNVEHCEHRIGDDP